MRPSTSKKKARNRKGKPPRIDASAPTFPDLQPSCSQSVSPPTDTLLSTSQSSSVDLARLSSVFSSLSLDQIQSAYEAAGCDLFKAVGILGTPLELEGTEVDERKPKPGPAISESSSQKKPRKARPPRHVAVSCGTVSGVIGKGYDSPRSAVSGRNMIQGEVGLENSTEESEQFLCSMLGEESDLGLGVVRDILGVCGGNVEKALEMLLELSDPTYSPQVREGSRPCAQNSLNYSHVFRGMDCKNSSRSNMTPLPVEDRPSSLTYFPSKGENDLFPERLSWNVQSAKPRQSIPEIEQQVLESLFNIHESREMHTGAPGYMDWKKIVKRLQNGEDSELHSMPASSQKFENAKGDGYHEFRTVAQRKWELMKTYYQRAALEYSRGNRSHASCLAEKGNYYRDLAREEDEKASLEIFGARNQGIKNTVTIDLHGQHIKQAMGLLKRHLLLFACISSVHYLKVITGCGENGVGKGKMKRSVKNLAIRENIEWTEVNSGTIMLNIEGQKEYTFADVDSSE